MADDNKEKTPQPQPQPVIYYQPPPYQDDEISLVDLWRTLARRKMLLLGVFLATMLGAAVYLLLAPPVYESRLTVQVGKVGQDGWLEDLSATRQRLLAQHPELVAVEAPRGGANNIFHLTVQQNDREEAGRQLRQIGEQLLRDHRAGYEDALASSHQRLADLKAGLHDYRQNLSEWNSQIEQLRSREPAVAGLLLLERENLYGRMVDAEGKIDALERSLAEANTFPTRLLGAQTTPEKPIKPKAPMILALSLVLGAMLGIFAAFFAEFIAKARKEMQ